MSGRGRRACVLSQVVRARDALQTGPVKKVARTFKVHLAGIVSIFKHGFCNALAEGVNSRIQLLMQKSCGYRNRQRLKTDILFHLGCLNMDPLSAQ